MRALPLSFHCYLVALMVKDTAGLPSKEAPSVLSSPEVQASWVGVLSPYAAVGSLSHSVMNGADSDPSSERNSRHGDINNVGMHMLTLYG